MVGLVGVGWGVVYCNAMHCITIQYTVLQYITLQYTVLHFSAKTSTIYHTKNVVSFCIFQSSPKKTKTRRLQYDRSNLLKAYNAVKEKRLPVKVAARQFGVPVMTLRDRVLGKVSLETTKPGPDSLFSMEEELTLVEHLETMAQMGYGYTHAQLKVMAADLAVSLGKRDTSQKMSNNWIYRFLDRWKERLASMKPRGLESSRAKSATPEAIENYYNELERIMNKYDLKDKPHRIFNLDETGLQPEHRPPNVIASSDSKPQSITSPRGTTVTLIGCINAIGSSLPPYFVFKGKQMNTDLMTGALPGSGYAMSETGWSNSNIFKRYLQEHFLTYSQAGKNANEHTLLLYDGHSSHLSKEVINWALENKIVLFVLPPHTSHLLQPLDVGCYGPFKSYYYSECSQWMRCHIVITNLTCNYQV